MRKLLVSLLLVVGLWLTVHHLRAPRIAPEAIYGLWSQYAGTAPADEVRFYYFHQGNKGLYRYGQLGHNQTHSFDWTIEGNELHLTFRKTGEKATSVIELGGSGRARTLTLRNDPRGEGAVRYQERKSQLDAGPLELGEAGPDGEATVLDGRIWAQHTRYATGGAGFVMYQLSQHACPHAGAEGTDAALGGWRLGWYHRGDFDDWSTETLCYRSGASSLDLHFILHAEQATTPMELGQDGRRRVVTLRRDPRNFLHRTRLVDFGPSF